MGPRKEAAGISILEEGEAVGEESPLAEAHGKGEGPLLCNWAFCPGPLPLKRISLLGST